MAKFVAYLIYLFLFLLPWQTRLILRSGVINEGNWEYGIIGVFGTEILLWIIFAVQLFDRLIVKKNKKIFSIPGDHPQGNKYFILIFVLFLIFNVIFVAADKLVAWQQAIHIVEAIILFYFVSRVDKIKAIFVFLFGLALSASLGIYQFLTQTTFASRWLGITLHDPTILGTSVLENAGERWLRAYGAFQHPNILGGYLALAIIMIIQLLNCSIIKRKVKVILLFVSGLLITALFFSFSRGAWLALIVALLFNCFLAVKNKKIFNIKYPILIIVLFFLFSLFFRPLVFGRLTAEGRLENWSKVERKSGYNEAWQMLKRHPFLGVGLGNYTLAVHNEIDSRRPSQNYQPAHNALMLAVAEAGISGLLFLLASVYFLILSRESSVKNNGLKNLFFSPIIHYLLFIILLSLFDHYLWSLYPGLMLMAVGLGLLSRLNYENL